MEVFLAGTRRPLLKLFLFFSFVEIFLKSTRGKQLHAVPGMNDPRPQKGKNAFTDRSDKQQKTLIAIIFPDTITQFFSFLFPRVPLFLKRRRGQGGFEND